MNLKYGRDLWIWLKLGNTCIIGQTIRQTRHVSISQAMMGMTWACQVVRKERSFSNLQIRWGAKNTKGLGWFPIWGTRALHKKRGVGLENHMKNINRGCLTLHDCWWKTRHSKDTKATLRLTCTPIYTWTVGAWCCYKKPPHLWGQVPPAKNEDPNFHLAKNLLALFCSGKWDSSKHEISKS